MDEGTIALTIMSLLLGLSFLGLLIWGIKSGEFRNIEEPKYRMLKENEDRNQKSEDRREIREQGTGGEGR